MWGLAVGVEDFAVELACSSEASASNKYLANTLTAENLLSSHATLL